MKHLRTPRQKTILTVHVARTLLKKHVLVRLVGQALPPAEPTWRKHSCLPRRQSCRRLASPPRNSVVIDGRSVGYGLFHPYRYAQSAMITLVSAVSTLVSRLFAGVRKILVAGYAALRGRSSDCYGRQPVSAKSRLKSRAGLSLPHSSLRTCGVPAGGLLCRKEVSAGLAVGGGGAVFAEVARYSVDAMNQVALPAEASERHGLQPVVHLTANGKVRVEVGINEPVSLQGTIEMPPGTGKVLQYDWYLGRSDFAYEPATRFRELQAVVSPTRTVSFPAAGEYTITLRTFAQRDGAGDLTSPTLLQNLARVRIVVH